jgi:hypothetical protein
VDAQPLPSAAHPPAATERLRWEAMPDCYRPDYARSLTGVFPTLFSLLGRPAPGHADLLHCLPADSPRKARRGFVLCLDGMGFKEMALSGRFRALYPRYGTWITSVFPTITSCALSSLYQALPPARHGILGHYVWKDFPGAVVDMLRMQVHGANAPLHAAGFDVQRWKQEPGILESPAAEGLPGHQLMHYSIVNSGLSTYSYGKAQLGGFAETLEGFTKAARLLQGMDTGWVGLYLATVDTLSHSLTGDSPQVGLALRQIEEALSWMVGTLTPEVARETALFVVADHGQSTLVHTMAWSAEERDRLLAGTRALGFSGRVMHLYFKPGKEEEILAWLRPRIAHAGQVFRFDEVGDLIGPAKDPAFARQSLGDAVALLREGYNWDKAGLLVTKRVYPSDLVSQHGGLSWDEMFVPLLCAPLTAMLGE